MKYIAFIETSDIGAQYCAQATRNLGYEPIFLVQLSNYQADTLAQIKNYKYIDTKTTDANDLALLLSELNLNLAAVTTFLDSRLPVAAELAEILNIPGLPIELKSLKDKQAVVDKAPFLFPPSLEFNRNTTPVSELARFLEEHQSIIVKPRCTAGGLGALVINSFSQLQKAIETIPQISISSHLSSDLWMAQKFVSGELVSAEGYFHQGATHLWGLSSRRKVGNTESQALFPYSAGTNQINQKIKSQVESLFQSLNLPTAFFHLEFIITPQGDSFMIDPNIGRVGGGGLLEMIAIAFDMSPVKVCEFILKLSLFGKLDESSKLSHPNTSNLELVPATSLMYGSALGGTLDLVFLPKVKNIFHTQIIEHGARLTPMGQDNWSWAGVLSAPSDVIPSVAKQSRLLVNKKWEVLCY